VCKHIFETQHRHPHIHCTHTRACSAQTQSEKYHVEAPELLGGIADSFAMRKGRVLGIDDSVGGKLSVCTVGGRADVVRAATLKSISAAPLTNSTCIQPPREIGISVKEFSPVVARVVRAGRRVKRNTSGSRGVEGAKKAFQDEHLKLSGGSQSSPKMSTTPAVYSNSTYVRLRGCAPAPPIPQRCKMKKVGCKSHPTLSSFPYVAECSKYSPQTAQNLEFVASSCRHSFTQRTRLHRNRRLCFRLQFLPSRLRPRHSSLPFLHTILSFQVSFFFYIIF
jgi:hypothetical protein